MNVYKVTISCMDGLDMAEQMNAAMSLRSLLKAMQKAYTISIQSGEATDCRFSVQDPEGEITTDILKEKIGEYISSDQYKIRIVTSQETAPQSAEENEPTAVNEPEILSDEDVTDAVLAKIHEMIGADGFKDAAEELCRLGRAMSGMGDFFRKNTYVFSIDDGCGLTTALRYFAELANALDLIPSAEIAEFHLLTDSGEPGELNQMKAALASFLSGEKKTGVICIDLTRCCDALHRSEYREMLRMCAEERNGILVFRMPFIEPHALDRVIEILNDLFYIHAVTFDPFSLEDLFCAARMKASRFGFELDDDMLPVVADMIVHEKSDGRFYGIRTMEKIVTQLIYEKLRSGTDSVQTDAAGADPQSGAGGSPVLCACDYTGCKYAPQNGDLSGEEELCGLIGMESVTAQIREIISLVEYARANGTESPNLHMRFIGPPGTGKTTVARLIGKIMKERGILRTGVFCECSGNDLIAKYVGHTATKAAQICRDAYGGILFIDEAYALAYDGERETGSFREEAVNTILAQMENHRDDMVVIMAGYEQELDKLMRSNPGLAHRMPYVVRFDSYSREDLARIFFTFAEDKPAISDEVREHIRIYFKGLPHNIYHSPTFANARFVRNLYERTLSKAALRFSLEKTDGQILLREDFDRAASEITGTMTSSMVYGKERSGAVMFDHDDSSVCFADVCGEDEAKELLMEMIDFLRSPEKYQRIGATIPKGALLVGPPGTGKTMLAKAAAGEAGVPVLTLSGSDLISPLRGNGAEKIRDLFAQARKLAPCILFIDEIDAIGTSRNYSSESSTLIQLLAEMDGFGGREQILLLAATNRPEVLDPALKRPGRFDREIPVELPDVDGRTEILKHYLEKTNREEDMDIRAVASLASGMAGADLRNVVNEAALRALREGRDRLTQADLEESIEVVAVGYQKKGTLLTEHEKRVVCYHEIGHALAAALQTHSAPVKKITVLPRTGGTLGYSMQLDPEQRFLYTKTELENRILTIVAGRAAEEVHFHEVTTGASNDIEKATQLARRLVTRFGMTEEFDMVSIETGNSGYLGGQSRMSCSEATAGRVDAKVVEIVREQHRKAIELLKKNEDMLDRLAEYIFKKETITGEEFMAVLNGS